MNNLSTTQINIINANSTNNAGINISNISNNTQSTQLPITMLSNTKINQIVSSMSSTSPSSSTCSSPSSVTIGSGTTSQAQLLSVSSPLPNTSSTTSSYGGFAHCSNCGEYGVKAAFYGKSKLYCSVACQNGIKKQQQHATQGVKRTIEALNNSNSSVTNSPNFPSNSTTHQPILISGAHTGSHTGTPTISNLSASAIGQTSILSLSSSNTGSSNFTIVTPINSNTNNSVVPNNSLFTGIDNSTTNTFVTATIENSNKLATVQPVFISQLGSISNISNSQAIHQSSTTIHASAPQINQKTTESNVNQPETNGSKVLTQLNAKNIGSKSSTLNLANSSNINSNNNVISLSLSSSSPMVQLNMNGNAAKRPRTNSTVANSLASSSCSSVSNENESACSSTQNSEISIFSESLSSKPTTFVKMTSPPPTPVPFSENNPNSFRWHKYIEETKCDSAPVYLFKHVPLNDFWKKIMHNIIVEVPNLDLPVAINNEHETNKQVYWFASVIEYAGYLAKFRFLGYEDNEKEDFWMHMCDPKVHTVGWSAENDYTMIPPVKLLEKRDDWKSYLLTKLVGFKTLPKNFHKKVTESLKSKFKSGMLLEMVDKKTLSRMKISRIIDNIGGRLRMKYENSDDFDDFWCHQQSELIHPIGWSATVGHDIDATEEYKKKSLIKYSTNKYEANECTVDMFRKVRQVDSSLTFRKNLKLEAIDPLNLSAICVATVDKVLKNNYLMIKIDGVKEEGLDKFCYHRASSSIFPAGFCQRNSIPLQGPYNYVGKFNWENYLRETKSEFAPSELFFQDDSLRNPFKVGMKLESVDLMEPKMICVATVVAVVDRLIRLNFDGWEKEYDQWIDCESCDIYPIGWCELVNYNLETPKNKQDLDKQVFKKKPKKPIKKK